MFLNLTRFKDSDLTTQFLDLMCFVVNVGGGYIIPPEDEKEPLVRLVEQSRPRGRRNVRARGERGLQQPQPFKGGVPTDPFQRWVGT